MNQNSFFKHSFIYLGAVTALLFGIYVSTIQQVLEFEIKDHENLILFPTIAFWNEERQVYEIQIHGYVFTYHTDSKSKLHEELAETFLNAIQEILENRNKISSNSIEILERRLKYFLVDNIPNKQLTIQLLNSQTNYQLSNISLTQASKPNGHFEETLILPAASFDHLLTNQNNLIFSNIQASDGRNFTGSITFIQQKGIGVISDIDDTIKISNVLQKEKLFNRTFLEPFEAVPGMSNLYNHWLQELKDFNVSFHYISSSPWNLFQELFLFLQTEAHFPIGQFCLRNFRIKEIASVISLIRSPQGYKLTWILPLLQSFPQRKFVFIGDSGEKDPEVYAHIASQYPDQLLHIYIRHVGLNETNEFIDSHSWIRYNKVFSKLPREKWTIFSDSQIMSLQGEEKKWKTDFFHQPHISKEYS